MNTIQEMIELLQENPDVVALAEYGSATYTDSHIDGDYDIIVITAPKLVRSESLHFHIGDMPVDLNLRSLDQIRAMHRIDGFESILLDCRVIHDPSGEARRALDDLRVRHKTSMGRALEQKQIAVMRHAASHTFDKLREERKLPLLLKRYLLHQCVYWAVPQYFEIRRLQYKGEKYALAYLARNEPQMAEWLEQFYTTNDLREQGTLADKIQRFVLEPIGGLWRHGELLAFGDPNQGWMTFLSLFGETVAKQYKVVQ